ncbi:MAG TPA: hypothetical protein VIG82_10440 [Enteractinococcus sp.]
MASRELLQEIQAVGVTEGKIRSETELARIVAAHLDWRIQPFEGSVHEPNGELIAESLEELAQAGRKLGWFLNKPDEPPAALNWGAIHTNDQKQSADQVRRQLL